MRDVRGRVQHLRQVAKVKQRNSFQALLKANNSIDVFSVSAFDAVGVEADSNFTDAWAVGSDAWAVGSDAWAMSADAWAGGAAFDVILLYSRSFLNNYYINVSSV